VTDDLKAAAEAWLSEDPDPDTRAELQQLLDAGDTTELADRFAGTLEFGTAARITTTRFIRFGPAPDSRRT
jgi:phosphomannomutase